jgi:hypothetical protein
MAETPVGAVIPNGEPPPASPGRSEVRHLGMGHCLAVWR